MIFIWIDKWLSIDEDTQVLRRRDSDESSIDMPSPADLQPGHQLGQTVTATMMTAEAEQARRDDEAREQLEREQRKERRERLFHNQTVLYFCEGVVIGLVAITPGAGYVSYSSDVQCHRKA